jgi:hypothetical protein
MDEPMEESSQRFRHHLRRSYHPQPEVTNHSDGYTVYLTGSCVPLIAAHGSSKPYDVLCRQKCCAGADFDACAPSAVCVDEMEPRLAQRALRRVDGDVLLGYRLASDA